MGAAEASSEWAAAQETLREVVGRLTATLRSVRQPDVPALGQWSLAEVAMHVSQTWVAVPGLARSDLSRIYEALPDVAAKSGASLIADLADLDEMTMQGVRSDPERNLAVLADRIDEAAAELFAESAGRSAVEQLPWLVEGTTVARSVLTGHLLNETLVHGYDIARAAGLPWRIERSHAAMVLGSFFVPVFRSLDPRAMVDQERAKGVKATFDLRIRGAQRFFFAFDDGQLFVEDPSDRRVDCHISVDPAAFLLVAWGRCSQWPAIAKGQFLAWGRKPWLGPQLRSLMRNP